MSLRARSIAVAGSALAPFAFVLALAGPARADSTGGMGGTGSNCGPSLSCAYGFACKDTVSSNVPGDHSVNTGSGAAGGMASVPASNCGDGFCQTPIETPESCPEDCFRYYECVPGQCTTNADCANYYDCFFLTSGTENIGGAGPGVPLTGTCMLTVSGCEVDSECFPDSYCAFGVDTTGSSSSGAGGFNAGGAWAGAGRDGAPDSTAGSGSSIPALGVCTPRHGTGGTGGTGAAGNGGGVIGGMPGYDAGGFWGVDGLPGAAGAGTTRSGGAGVGTTGVAGTTSSGSGGGSDCPVCGATGTGGTSTIGVAPSGTGGTAPTGAVGTGVNDGSVSSSAGASGERETHEVFTNGGCAVAAIGDASSFGGFAFIGLALAWVTRRRRPV
jgi:MYXO-CTERM domain-containing protein